MWHYAGWGWGPGFFFCILFVIVIIGFIARLLWFRHWGGCGWGPGRFSYQDHEDVLKRRLAAGEISEEEYNHLRDVLHR